MLCNFVYVPNTCYDIRNVDVNYSYSSTCGVVRVWDDEYESMNMRVWVWEWV